MTPPRGRRTSAGSQEPTGSAGQDRASREAAAKRRAEAAEKYRPGTIDLLLVAEAPPKDLQRYFYFEDAKGHDALFRRVARHLLGVAPDPEDKPAHLERIKQHGVFLIDLKPDPDDPRELADHVPDLVRRVQELAPRKIVIIKTTVYDAAYEALRRAGLPLVDVRIPFPGSGQQKRFDEMFALAIAQAPPAPSLEAPPRPTRAGRAAPAVTPEPIEAPRAVLSPSPIESATVAVAPSPVTATSVVGLPRSADGASVVGAPARSADPAPTAVGAAPRAAGPATTPAPTDATRPRDRKAVEELVVGTHGAPFDVLGPHPAGPNKLSIRAFLPGASSAAVELGGRHHPMVRLHDAGFFEATLADVRPATVYRLWTMAPDGTTATIDDPYRFEPLLTDFDFFLFGEGTHERLWEKLGAHLVTHQGVKGVHFAIWAPNATRVSVIGDFNQWDERRHPMRNRGVSGVWELFIPGLEAGELYKYDLRTRWGGASTVKADPYGFAMEQRPNTASKVWDLSRYRWKDSDWMSSRRERQGHAKPMTIYEVHPGSWRRGEDGRWLTWRELADQLVPYVRDLGYTHIELMPISEHPFDGSWGYQPVGYYAPTARFGTPDDFRVFVDAAHQAGLGVLLDWVPAHFPKDAHGLGFFDGTHLYEHADPRLGQHEDWGTLIFNFSRPEVAAFLLSNALFWLEQYHVDGLRVDAVASMLYLDYSRKEGEWVPNRYGGRENIEAIDFIRRFNVLVHGRFPDVLTIAEESTSWPMVSRPVHLGGLGFDMKWNMGWMHDMLAYMSNDPVFRRHNHEKLTFSLLYAFTENFVLPLSHDEVVHLKRSLVGKMPGDRWRKFANLRALYAYMYGHPGKKLLFMGGEIAQPGEWNHDAELAWDALDEADHLGIQRLVRDLNRLHRDEPALHEVDFDWTGFQWIDFRDVDQSIVAFVRRARDPNDLVVVAANLTPVPRPGYRIGAPAPGVWRELLNTDRAEYGGSDYTDLDGVVAEPVAWQEQEQSLLLDLPPLAVVMLKPEERLTVAPDFETWPRESRR